MGSTRLCAVVGMLSLILLASASRARSGGGDVYWHTSPYVKSCSMVIDPSLTQSQWSRFTREAGATVTFKVLGPAATLGRKHFRVVIDNSNTPVDQHDPAWINTFTHPSYKDCPLGDAIKIPTVRAEVGVSDRVDIGGFWTTAPEANYGMAGGEVKYAFLSESGRLPTVAARAGVTALTGVPDFNMSIYNLDLLASRRVTRFAPYVGIRESLSVGTETTDKVDLKSERIAITQGYAGLACSLWKVRLAAEYDVSFVNTFAFAAGFGF